MHLANFPKHIFREPSFQILSSHGHAAAHFFRFFFFLGRVLRRASAPAPAPAAVRDAFNARARRVLKAAPRILEDLVEMASSEDQDLVELAGHAQRAAGHAQRMIDELDALQLSVGKRGEHPPPSPSVFAGGASSSAASRTAPPSGNPAPRRRPKTRSTETAGDDVDMEGL